MFALCVHLGESTNSDDPEAAGVAAGMDCSGGGDVSESTAAKEWDRSAGGRRRVVWCITLSPELRVC